MSPEISIFFRRPIFEFFRKIFDSRARKFELHTKKDQNGAYFPVFGLFRYFLAHFLDIEGYGEECKVHCDLVFAKVTEAAVCHVELHLSEDCFRFDTS